MRPDLQTLDEDALAALANRGLVKRAAREVADGRGPRIALEHGDVVGDFDDGTRAVLPDGVPLTAATCSCPASGICRHLLALVLTLTAAAPRRDVPASAAQVEPQRPVERWSPAEFDEIALAALLGPRVLTAARRAHRRGYRARVLRPTPADPVPTVELASVTVRFLVPHELGYARVDAAEGTRADAVALAVWASAAADALDPDADVVDVQVGGTGTEDAGVPGEQEVRALLSDLLEDGVVHGQALRTALAQARAAVDAGGARWLLDGLDDLADMLAAHRDRSARYDPRRCADLVAELLARVRCAGGGGASLRSAVLGTTEAGATPLRVVRLHGLGATVSGDAEGRTVEVHLGSAEAGSVLTLRRRVEGEGDAARLRAGGVRLTALASGDVVTASAVRSADRQVRIADSRAARTTTSPSRGDWGDLPEGLLVRDLDAEADRLAGLPPRVVRPRIVAETLRVLAVDSVAEVSWDPGAQRLSALLRAPVGSARLEVVHSTAAAGAVDATAAALEAGPAFVAGHLHRRGGEVVVRPTALVSAGAVVVPDLVPPAARPLAAGAVPAPGPLEGAVAEARTVLADVVHLGRRHLPPSWADRRARAAKRLRDRGLTTTAAALGPCDRDLDAWTDAALRLLLLEEQL